MSKYAHRNPPAPARAPAFPFILTVLMIIGCQNVVSIDLNQTAPQVVVEGIVTNRPGPCAVRLTRTGNYFEPSLTFQTISHALVVVGDGGLSDTLHEDTSGHYVSSTLAGVPGHTYTLRVVAEAKEYDAASTMPPAVRIDSLYTTRLREFDGDRGYNIFVKFRDPGVVGNYYRIRVHSTAFPSDSITGQRYMLLSDKLINGNEVTYQLRAARNVQAGDTMMVELMTMDRAAYDYFNTLKNVLASNRSPTSLAPMNPVTNLSNGALGYFSAFAIDSARIVLP